jgi:hypothetical protein
MRILAFAALLALTLALVPMAEASQPLPAGVTVDPAGPRVCVWTDPGDDVGSVTCVDPTNPECLVYTVYETIAGPFFICHVPAP